MIRSFITFKSMFENIDIESTMSNDETVIVNNFDWSPYNVEVLTCHADIDESTAHVTIKMTNGDLIAYHCRKSRGSNKGSPYTFSLEVNHKNMGETEKELLWEKYFGSTGSLVADILLYYKERVLSKK